VGTDLGDCPKRGAAVDAREQNAPDAVLPPLIQLVIFGYAVNLDLEHTRMPGWIWTGRPKAAIWAHRSRRRDTSRVVATPEDEQQVQDLMDRSKVQAVIRVLPGFARDIGRGETAVCRFWWRAPIRTRVAGLELRQLVVAGFAARVGADQQR
jgi:hypothetical protein